MSSQSQWRFRPRVTGLESRDVPAPIPASAIVVGPEKDGDPEVKVLDPGDGRMLLEVRPFEGKFLGGIRPAVGDVTGDGTPDLVAAAGPGGGPRVQVYDGATARLIRDFFVYEPTFVGGVTVSVGDVNGDGRKDLIFGTGQGGGPRVVAMDFKTSKVLADFFAYEPTFRGGVNVAAADVNRDGAEDIVVGTGVGGAPRVTVHSGRDPRRVLHNFFAYDESFRNGVNVGGGDINGDGYGDVVTGAGLDGGPHVRVIDGRTGGQLGSLFAFGEGERKGVRVAVVDADGNGRGEIVVVKPGEVRRFFRSGGAGSEFVHDTVFTDPERDVVYVGATGVKFKPGAEEQPAPAATLPVLLQTTDPVRDLLPTDTGPSDLFFPVPSGR